MHNLIKSVQITCMYTHIYIYTYTCVVYTSSHAENHTNSGNIRGQLGPPRYAI